MHFDFLLSIGSACKTRSQTERLMKKKDETWSQKRNFFDWLMQGGVKGVTKIFEQDLYLKAEEFEVVELNKKYIPQHKKSSLMFLHDFGMNSISRTSYEETIQTMKNNLEETIGKYNHIRDNTKRLLQSKLSVALVYYGPIGANETTNLLATLKNQYSKDFHVINVIEKSRQWPRNLHPSITNLEVNDDIVGNGEDSWRGSDDEWDKAFEKISFHPKKE